MAPGTDNAGVALEDGVAPSEETDIDGARNVDKNEGTEGNIPWVPTDQAGTLLEPVANVLAADD